MCAYQLVSMDFAVNSFVDLNPHYCGRAQLQQLRRLCLRETSSTGDDDNDDDELLSPILLNSFLLLLGRCWTRKTSITTQIHCLVSHKHMSLLDCGVIRGKWGKSLDQCLLDTNWIHENFPRLKLWNKQLFLIFSRKNNSIYIKTLHLNCWFFSIFFLRKNED